MIVVVALVTTSTAASAQALVTPANGTHAAISGTTTVTVTNVVDGDTVDVRYANGSTDTVRLLGVDTPEVYVENTPSEFEGVPDTQAGTQCLGDAGDAASTYATNRLSGETVTLQFDSQADRRGSYGRLLAYIQLDGSNFNYDLVETGHARVYDSSFSKSESFYSAESAAQSAERSLWSCRTPGSGSGDDDGSDGSTGDASALTINWVNAEASSLNDERVKITNTGSSALDLSGYTLSDKAGYSYTFSSFTLGAGDSVYVHTGSGSDDADDVYIGYETEIWNDGGDTATVTTAGGTTADQLAY